MDQFFESQEIREIEGTLTQLYYVTQAMWSPWGKVACGLNHLMRRTSTCVFVQKQTQWINKMGKNKSSVDRG